MHGQENKKIIVEIGLVEAAHAYEDKKRKMDGRKDGGADVRKPTTFQDFSRDLQYDCHYK